MVSGAAGWLVKVAASCGFAYQYQSVPLNRMLDFFRAMKMIPLSSLLLNVAVAKVTALPYC